MSADSLPIEIQERQYGTAQRHPDNAGWRGQKRNCAKKIADQDENGDRSDPGHVTYAFVPNIFFQQIFDSETQGIRQQEFRDLLRRPRPLHGQMKPHPKRQQRADDQHQQRHHHVFGNRQFGIAWLDVQRGKQSHGYAAEVVIHKVSQPAYVFHLNGTFRVSSYFSGRAISYTLAATAATARAHMPTTMLARGTLRKSKITYTIKAIKA